MERILLILLMLALITARSQPAACPPHPRGCGMVWDLEYYIVLLCSVLWPFIFALGVYCIEYDKSERYNGKNSKRYAGDRKSDR